MKTIQNYWNTDAETFLANKKTIKILNLMAIAVNDPTRLMIHRSVIIDILSDNHFIASCSNGSWLLNKVIEDKDFISFLRSRNLLDDKNMVRLCFNKKYTLKGPSVELRVLEGNIYSKYGKTEVNHDYRYNYKCFDDMSMDNSFKNGQVDNGRNFCLRQLSNALSLLDKVMSESQIALKMDMYKEAGKWPTKFIYSENPKEFLIVQEFKF